MSSSLHQTMRFKNILYTVSHRIYDMVSLSYTADDRLGILGIISFIVGVLVLKYYSFVPGLIIIAAGILLMLPMALAIFGLSENGGF